MDIRCVHMIRGWWFNKTLLKSSDYMQLLTMKQADVLACDILASARLHKDKCTVCAV